MGAAAILVMWPRCCEQNIVPPTQGKFKYNLALIGKAILEKKIFEHCERRRRTPDHEYHDFKLTYEPLAQVS